MLNDDTGQPSDRSATDTGSGATRRDTSTNAKLNLIAIAIALALAATFIITVAGMNYVDKIHMTTVKEQNVLRQLMEIKASALSTIMLDPGSPDTKAIFSDAGRKIQSNSRLSLENIGQPEVNGSLNAILAQWREYEQASNDLIALSSSSPKEAKERIGSLYKQKFIPFQNGLELLIAEWAAIAETAGHEAAKTSQMVKSTISALIVLIMIAIVTMVYYITRSINATIREKEESFRLLGQKEALLSATQGMAKIGGWEFDIEKQVTYWTDEVYRIHGMAREDMPPGSVDHISKSAECYAPESRPLVMAAFQKCVNEGIDYDMELPFTSVKGRKMWIRTSGKAVYRDGKIVRVIGNIMDITERKTAENAVARSTAELKEAQRIAHVGSWYLVNATNHVTWSDQLYRMLGLDPALPAPDYTEHSRLFTPESWARLSTALPRTQEAGVPYELELEVVRADGKSGWMLARGEPVRDAQGVIIGLQGTAQDITERKGIEMALRGAIAKAKNFSDALDNVPSYIYMKGLDHKYFYANKTTLKLFNCSEGDLAGSGDEKYFPPETVARLKAVDDRVLERGETTMEEIDVSPDSPDRRVYWEVKHPIYDDAGKIIGLCGVSTDITGRKVSEDALRESENLLKTVLELLPVGVWILNAKGELVSGNNATHRIWAGKRLVPIDRFGEYKGWRTDTGKLVGPHEWAGARALEKGEISNNEEILIQCFDGTKKTILDSGVPIRGVDGRIKGAVTVNQDITERKAAEENLKAAKIAAEEATKLKDKFVSLVAHDLKGPLGSLVAYLKQLGRGALDPEEAGPIFSTAIATGENMLGLIQDLLNISRIKVGKLKPDLRFVPAYYFAVKAVEEFRHRAGQKGVAIENRVRRDTRLFADETLFYEVVRNLVSNAIKFSSRGRRVRIFTPDDMPSAIAVADDGVGIDARFLPHLFEYETRTSTPGTSGEMGTGLGLPLSHDIMVAHGGRLWVESAKGKGSVFRAELPPVEPKILLVDADPLARLFLERCAKSIGAEPVSAKNGGEAVELLGAVSPHLVIADVNLPEVEGFELAGIIRKDPATAKTPIILTSAFSDPALAARVAETHLDDFISKPFMEEEVVAKIRRILG